MYTFAERLKGFRTREGLSQQALAYELGVHRNTISAWERGEYLPDTREMVLDLAEALRLSPADTNLLLAAAQYPPEPIATGDERGAARFEEAYVGLLVVDRLETGSSAPPGPIPTRVPESRARRLMGRLPDGRLLAEAETGRRAPQPPRGETLFGRDAAQEQLVCELCAAGGSPSLALTALRGLPGVGKTALAKAVANDARVARAFPDGRAWLELGPQADPFRLLGQALADFGAPVDDLSDVDSRAARLRSVLAGRRALLVLDDVWQAAHAEPLLAAVQPPARALLTTRLPQVAADLHAANHEIEVLPPAAASSSRAAASPEARQAVEADEPGAAGLAKTLGYLPLALKVAGRRLARRARADGPRQAVAHLQREVAQRLLTLTSAEGRPGLAAAEPSLEAILALSYDALPDDAARAALRRLAVFGGQPLDYDAAAMAAVWQVDEEEASELRLALVEAGLVERTPRDGEPRYALHQVIAHFARARLAADPGEERAAALAHARRYSHVVGGYDDAIREGRMTYGAPLEWENVAVALERLAAQSAADDEAAAILLDYARSWRNVLYNNHDPRRLRWLHAAVATAQRVGSAWDQANVLKAQGDVLAFLDQRQDALAKYDAALALFRTVGARLGEANVLKAQGDVLYFLKQTQDALAKYDAALALFRTVGARLGEANVSSALARYMFSQDREAAVASLQQVRGLREQIGDIYGLANDLRNFAPVLIQEGRGADALPYLEEAKQLFLSRNLTKDAQIVDAQLQLAGPASALFQPEALSALASNPMGFLEDMAAAMENIDIASLLPMLPPVLQQAIATNDLGVMQEALTNHLPPKFAEILEGILNPDMIKDQLRHLAATARETGDHEALVHHLHDLCDICIEDDDTQTLLAAAEELIALGAADADIYCYLAEAAFEMGNFEQGHQAYQQAINLEPENGMIRRNYVNHLISHSMLDEAAIHLDAAARIEPDALYLALRRAELAKAHGDQVETARWAEEALRRQPNWNEAQALLDWARG